MQILNQAGQMILWLSLLCGLATNNFAAHALETLQQPAAAQTEIQQLTD